MDYSSEHDLYNNPKFAPIGPWAVLGVLGRFSIGSLRNSDKYKIEYQLIPCGKVYALGDSLSETVSEATIQLEKQYPLKKEMLQ
jgi:hypothetical protein